MFYSQNISELRQFYLDSWNKQLSKQTLTPIEEQICQVLHQHPEYQKWLNPQYLETTFNRENPFLHMGLHLAIKEQIQTNRPTGIQEIYFQFVKKNPLVSNHEVEHIFMDVLARTLWEAQQHQQAPNEELYLLACKAL
jgi:hypothetical protein